MVRNARLGDFHDMRHLGGTEVSYDTLVSDN